MKGIPEQFDLAAEMQVPLEGQLLTIDLCASFLAELGICVRNNLLTKETEVTGNLNGYSEANAPNILPTVLADLLRQNKVKGVTTTRVKEILSCIADANRYNPVEEYLHGLRWDGEDRLTGIYNILNVSATEHKTYIRKWMIQCVALGLNDYRHPVSAEGVLVLDGAQGLGKTSVFRALSPFQRWFAEGVSLDMRDKDSKIQALSSWICELGELDGTTKKEQPALKAFLTQCDDRIRYPYDRAAIVSPRMTSFCGTVNGDTFLRDITGSRRFWVVRLEKIDKETLFALSQKSKDQLWAQVYEMYLENPNGFRLTDEEMVQLQRDNAQFEVPLPYETEIRDLLDYDLGFDDWEWWSAAKLQQVGIIGSRSGDAEKIGRVLTKLTKEFEWKGFKRPSGESLKRKAHGVWQYLIPLRQFPAVVSASPSSPKAAY